MIHPLPVHTVLEEKLRTKRSTQLLFVLLFLFYLLFFTPMLVVILLSLDFRAFFPLMKNNIWTFNVSAALIALLIAIVHFRLARRKTLEEILTQLGAKPVDPKDMYHKYFKNIVIEAESATGIRPIFPVVIPIIGCNAFSVEDGNHKSAIGVTEGLLARLDRPQLTAVVSHEAAHIVHGDTKLATTASSIMGAFDLMRILLGKSRGLIVTHITKKGYFALARPFLRLLAGVGKWITGFIYLAISRKREYLADAHAVDMCKDPLSLAEALNKISQKYRGSLTISSSYSSLFILSPLDSRLDEEDGFLADLFSTHPPVARRIGKLMRWARTDVLMVREETRKIRFGRTHPSDGSQDTSHFFANINGKWEGPFLPSQLLSMELFSPDTWIFRNSDDKIKRASDEPSLLSLFKQNTLGMDSGYQCPRCKLPLVETSYEGAPASHCDFCKGYLLKSGVLERIIVRRDEEFSEDEIERAKTWRNEQENVRGWNCNLPRIGCPICGKSMHKYIHSVFTMVVIDKCSKGSCGAIWCDGGEMEKIQILVEEAT